MAGWSALQLSEFFSAITRAGDVDSAARIAVQRAAESTDAEVAAVVCGTAVPWSVGLGRRADASAFTDVQAGADLASFPRLGTLHVTAQALDRDTDDRLIVARTDEPFAAEERQMLQGMARVLGLALLSLRTLDAERRLRREREAEAETRLALVQALERRERLLETLLRVQRAANQRTPIGEVLDAITEGAGTLLDGAATALVLRDAADPAGLTVASLHAGTAAAEPDGAALLAAAGRAMTADHPVTAGPMIAVPVLVGDDVAGSFVIAGPAGEIRESERRDVLAAFAEQASLALTGAHTLAAIREAHHDPLTRLPTRGLFLQRVEQVLGAGPAPAGAALLYLDLDLFKQVNDTLGHAAGDELLRGVADRLCGAIRDSDMAARLGGDEFAVLLEPLDDEQQARDIAERVIEEIGRPFDIVGRTVHTRASVGIAYSDHGRSAERLIEDADLAMYRAKKTRPGTCREFEPRMRAELLSVR
jgi:diguanylate cyclase (GGDEF)-like protein